MMSERCQGQLLQKTVWRRFLGKLNIDSPYDPPLGIYPKGSKAGPQGAMCTPMFVIAYSQQPGGERDPGAP